MGLDNVQIEQNVPSWDRVTEQGTEHEHAVLDVILPVQGRTIYVDVSIAEATSSDPRVQRARASRMGVAARDREADKHRRYPGADLLPGVLEGGGRWGIELRGFVKAVAPTGGRRAAAINDLRQRLAVALQRGVAAMLLGSAGKAQRPWRA